MDLEKEFALKQYQDKLVRLEAMKAARPVLDLLDDLHGQSCTPITLRKADFAVSTLREHYGLLKEEQGLFFGDETRTQAERVEKYRKLKDRAMEWQIPSS